MPIAPIPITEMTTSVADHKKNEMAFMPVEQKYLLLILQELKEIKELLKR